MLLGAVEIVVVLLSKIAHAQVGGPAKSDLCESIKLLWAHPHTPASPRRAGEKGVEERDIQRQTGHKSVQVLRGYIRHGSLFKRNAAAQVGL